MEEHQIATEIDRIPDGEANDGSRTPENVDFDTSRPHTGDGASPGKIFIGGLARETTPAQFIKHFGKYGEITDSVIMKDRNTGQPRGFGFVTYADSAVVDKVIEDTHVFHGKQVEIKRTIPRGAHSTGFKTKKIFVGGIPTTVDEDEFRDFFSSYGEVKEQQIMRDHSTGRSRGFGFITFDSEQSVDDLLVNGNRLDFAGVQVEIKKAEPKKPNALPPPSRRQSNSRAGYGGGVGDTYGGFGGGGGGGGSGYGGSGFGASSYRSGGAYGGRASAYGGYGGSEFGAYGGYGAGSYGGLRSEASYGYSSRFGGGAGAGFGRGYDLGGEYGGPGDSYAGYGGNGGAGGGAYGGGGTGGSAYGGGGAGGYGGGSGGGYGSGGYDAAFGGGYGGGGGGGGSGSLYGSRGGYGGAGSGRYHPYGR